MFGTIRRHQKWLWVIIIALTVVSFVFFFSPNSKYSGQGGGRGKGTYGTLRGKEISQIEFLRARNEILIFYFLMHGEWPDKDSIAKRSFDPDRETYSRLFLIEKQKEFNISISDKAVNDLLLNILHGGREKNVSLEDFERQILLPRGLTRLDLENFLRHNLGNQELISVIGLPGALITPQEAESLFRHENEEVVCEVAFFSGSNFLSKVTVNSNAVANFHQLHQADYRIPEKIQVNYVRYDVTNFLPQADVRLGQLTNQAEVINYTKTIGNFLTDADVRFGNLTNLDQLAELIYTKRGTNFYKDSKSPDDAKVEIKKELRHSAAISDAMKKAGEFAEILLNVDPPKPELFSVIAATNGLTVKTTAPFSSDSAPADLKVSPRFNHAAFNLNRETPFAGPFDEEDAVYVIGLNKMIPSENPPFDSIREKVTADFKYAQAIELARQAANNFVRGFSNAPSATDFSIAAVAAKAEYIKAPKFALSTRKLPEIEDRISLSQLENAAFNTATGKISELNPTQDGAFVLHLSARVPVDDQKMKQDFPAFVNVLKQTRQREAFDEWFRKTATEELRDIPALQQKNSGAAPR